MLKKYAQWFWFIGGLALGLALVSVGHASVSKNAVSATDSGKRKQGIARKNATNQKIAAQKGKAQKFKSQKIAGRVTKPTITKTLVLRKRTARSSQAMSQFMDQATQKPMVSEANKNEALPAPRKTVTTPVAVTEIQAPKAETPELENDFKQLSNLESRYAESADQQKKIRTVTARGPVKSSARKARN